MAKRLISILFALFVTGTCRAQNTTVTATVVDPNSIPYAFSTGYAALVCPGNQAPTYNGYSVPRTFTITAFDGTGKFTQVVYDVSLLVPAGCGYQWHITYKDGITNFITGTITTVTGASVNESVAISAFAVLLPSPPVTTPPGGSSGQVQYNNSGTFGGILGSSVTPATGATSLTAGADSTKPLAINSHSNTQSANLLDVNNQSGGTPTAPVVVRGRGFGSFDPSGVTSLMNLQQDSQSTASDALVITNRQAVGSGSVLSTLEFSMLDAGTPQICGGNAVGDGGGAFACLIWVLGTGFQGITAEIGATGTLNTVPFTVADLAVGATADLMDCKNSSGTVCRFDKNANLAITENNSIVGIAGTDQLWPNSTAHRWEMVNNNGTPAIIAGFADFTAPPSGGLLGAIIVCSGQIALTTGAISSGTRATNTLTCTGLSTSTDSISCTFSGDTNAVTGYAPSASGGLTIKTWVSTNTINADQVNNTSGSITPGSATLNCKGIR